MVVQERACHDVDAEAAAAQVVDGRGHLGRDGSGNSTRWMAIRPRSRPPAPSSARSTSGRSPNPPKPISSDAALRSDPSTDEPNAGSDYWHFCPYELTARSLNLWMARPTGRGEGIDAP